MREKNLLYDSLNPSNSTGEEVKVINCDVKIIGGWNVWQKI